MTSHSEQRQVSYWSKSMVWQLWLRLTRVNFSVTSLKLAEKFDHPFPHLFIFGNSGSWFRSRDGYNLKIFRPSNISQPSYKLPTSCSIEVLIEVYKSCDCSEEVHKNINERPRHQNHRQCTRKCSYTVIPHLIQHTQYLNGSTKGKVTFRTHHRTVLQNGPDKTPKTSHQERLINVVMKYSTLLGQTNTNWHSNLYNKIYMGYFHCSLNSIFPCPCPQIPHPRVPCLHCHYLVFPVTTATASCSLSPLPLSRVHCLHRHSFVFPVSTATVSCSLSHCHSLVFPVTTTTVSCSLSPLPLSRVPCHHCHCLVFPAPHNLTWSVPLQGGPAGWGPGRGAVSAVPPWGAAELPARGHIGPDTPRQEPPLPGVALLHASAYVPLRQPQTQSRAGQWQALNFLVDLYHLFRQPQQLSVEQGQAFNCLADQYFSLWQQCMARAEQ